MNNLYKEMVRKPGDLCFEVSLESDKGLTMTDLSFALKFFVYGHPKNVCIHKDDLKVVEGKYYAVLNEHGFVNGVLFCEAEIVETINGINRIVSVRSNTGYMIGNCCQSSVDTSSCAHGYSLSLYKVEYVPQPIDPNPEEDQLIAEELFGEKLSLPELTADRAIADEHGNRIADTYETRQAVRNHIREAYNEQFNENPPLIMDGYITPQMLSESTKELLENTGQNITNVPDGEDLTTKQGVLKLSDKPYNPGAYSGMGRIYLRKNLVGGQNLLTQAMVSKPNTIYILQYDYTLDGKSITIPEGCVLSYEGGSIRDGHINYTDTKIQGYESLSEVVESGTAIHIDNEERKLNGQGMDCIILKKTPYLTQDMVSKPNTIYIIRYDYDLNDAEITIPEGCVLNFQGGSLSNGTIVGNNTAITSGSSVVFGEHIALNGSWSGPFLIDWFGDIKEYKKDSLNDSSFIINRAVQIVPSGNTLILNKSNIFINDSIVINKELNVQLYSKIFYGGENTKPTIIIHDTARMSLEVFDIINVSPVFNYREDASYEYNVSVVLENVIDSTIKIRKIENYCTGVFLFGNNGGVHYNKIEVLDFYTCFNGVRITSNEGGWCNGNVIEKCAYNYHSWPNIGEWVPYFIVSNSYKSNGTPYANNGNVFQNITLEYNPTVATQRPKLLKAESALGYRINVDRVEITVGEDGMHDLVHLGKTTRAIVINVAYSYYKIKPLDINASHNLLIQQGGGNVVGFTPYVLNLKDSLVFEEGVNPIHVIYKIDTITGLVVFNAVLSITSAVSTIVNIAAPTTINVIAGFRSESSNFWTTPEIVETVPIWLSTAGNLAVMTGTIAAKSVLYINASYYLFDNI